MDIDYRCTKNNYIIVIKPRGASSQVHADLRDWGFLGEYDQASHTIHHSIGNSVVEGICRFQQAGGYA